MRRTRGLGSTVIALTLWAGAAAAQGRTTERAYDHANALRSTQRMEEALAAYRALHAETREARALAQVGVTEAQMGRWVDAEEHIVQSLASPDRWVRRHRAGVELALAQVRQHLTDLTVTANVAGAELRVNDVSMGRLPRAAVRVPIGPVVIDVVAEGYEPHRENVQAVAPSTQRTVTLVARQVRVTVSTPESPATPAAAPAVGTPTPSARVDVVVRAERPGEGDGPLRVDLPLRHPPQRSGVTRTLAWTGTIGAVAFAATGVVALVVGSGAAETWNGDGCLGTAGTRAENCASEQRTADAMQALAVAGFVGGGALAITAAALFVASGHDEAPARAGLSCGAGPGLVGAACGWRF